KQAIAARLGSPVAVYRAPVLWRQHQERAAARSRARCLSSDHATIRAQDNANVRPCLNRPRTFRDFPLSIQYLRDIRTGRQSIKRQVVVFARNRACRTKFPFRVSRSAEKPDHLKPL